MEMSYMAAPGCVVSDIRQKLTAERIEREKQKYDYAQKNIYETIIAHCMTYHGVNHEQIISNTRKREIVYTRQQAMYFGSKYSKLGLADLGSYFGKDHATVLHAKKTVENNIQTDRLYKKQIEELEIAIINSLVKDNLPFEKRSNIR